MLRVLSAALVIPLFLACSGTETPETINQPPTISFTFDPIAVPVGERPTLTVSVADPDGDPLTVTWDITSGTLTPANASRTAMVWNAPRSVGTDTVTVQVSDGALSAGVSEVIKRGTNLTGAGLDAFDFVRDNSPYILDPAAETISFGYPNHGTVSIEPGVEIYINKPDLAIEVLGLLESNGTEADTVLIRPNDRTLRCADHRGWWEGFRVITDDVGSGQVNMTYTQVSYGKKNLDVWQGTAGAVLQHCRMVCSGEAGVKMRSAGTLVVDRCDISGNRNHGIDVASLSAIPAEVTITGNRIQSNGHTGINLDLPDTGQTLSVTIEGNRIAFNAVHGIALAHAAWASIHHNDLALNNLSNLSNIWLESPYPGAVAVPADWDTLWATNNYWGRVYDPGEAGLIEATVRDKADNPDLGTYVVIDPWQNTEQYGN